jgi:hypothetical protein
MQFGGVTKLPNAPSTQTIETSIVSPLPGLFLSPDFRQSQNPLNSSPLYTNWVYRLQISWQNQVGLNKRGMKHAWGMWQICKTFMPKNWHSRYFSFDIQLNISVIIIFFIIRNNTTTKMSFTSRCGWDFDNCCVVTDNKEKYKHTQRDALLEHYLFHSLD